MPTSAIIGLTVFVSLPSILFLVFKIFPLTISASASFVNEEANDVFGLSPNSTKISPLISDSIFERFDLSISL